MVCCSANDVGPATATLFYIQSMELEKQDTISTTEPRTGGKALPLCDRSSCYGLNKKSYVRVGVTGIEPVSISDFPVNGLCQSSKTCDVDSYAFEPETLSHIDWESLPESVKAAVAKLLRSAGTATSVDTSACQRIRT